MRLQATGARVIYIGRTVLKRTVAAGELQITDWERPAWSIRQAAAELEVSYDTKSLLDNAPRIDCVFVCVKCTSNEGIAQGGNALLARCGV